MIHVTVSANFLSDRSRSDPFLLIKETMVILLLEMTIWHQSQIRENIFNVTDAMCS